MPNHYLEMKDFLNLKRNWKISTSTGTYLGSVKGGEGKKWISLKVGTYSIAEEITIAATGFSCTSRSSS